MGIGAGVFHFNGCGYGVGEPDEYAPVAIPNDNQGVPKVVLQ